MPFYFCVSAVPRRAGARRIGLATRQAALAQLGERQTEDLKVPGSIPGGGMFLDNPLRALRPARASANFCSGQLSVAQLVERGTVIGKTAAAIPRSVVRVHPGRPTFSNHRVRMAERSKALV